MGDERDQPEITVLEVGDVAVVQIGLRPPVFDDSALTEAERSIATLVADGLSNAEIADTRGTSARTVANQLRSISRKLGVSSRFELVAHGYRQRARESDS